LSIIIHLAPGKLTPKRQLYDAFLNGGWLLTSHDPEPAVCRELAKRGYSGGVEFRWGDRPGLIVKDLHTLAKKATKESERKGPLMVAYRPNQLPPRRTRQLVPSISESRLAQAEA
jgi:hypothetical protein